MKKQELLKNRTVLTPPATAVVPVLLCGVVDQPNFYLELCCVSLNLTPKPVVKFTTSLRIYG